jgi:hypothetical protein
MDGAMDGAGASAIGPGAGDFADVVGSTKITGGLIKPLVNYHLFTDLFIHYCNRRPGGFIDQLPRHCRGTEALLQALGSVTAMVRLTGTPSGTLPVRMRQAQPELAFISAPSERQQSAVGEAVLLMMKLRHGVKLEISDVVHDSGPAGMTTCPDAGAGQDSAAATMATARSLSSTLRPISTSFSAAAFAHEM